MNNLHSDFEFEEGSEQFFAIVGISLKVPGAENLKAFWDNIKHSRSVSTDLSDAELLRKGVSPDHLQNSDYVKKGYFLESIYDFDADFFNYAPNDAVLIDPQHRHLLEASYEALEDAGYVGDQNNNRVGVFIGVGHSRYLTNALLNARDKLDEYTFRQIAIGNEKDYAASRISYKLNLKGPCININTACSTSLVAISQACNNLLTYDCDIALAGAATICAPGGFGYWYEKDGIASPDGACRAFDSNAKGTVAGDGVGVVVLKRYQGAIEDGDNIYAVIRGIATNNDGASKNGFTAPGIDGQIDVVSRAQKYAGISPEQISYIEAHGTGTPLGDPIEIKALTEVFNKETSSKGFCALGSVKSNVGHLDTAAGVVGLAKVILSLKNEEIAPVLHFKKPNPELDLENSPFFINKELIPWKHENGKRIAGVSSFGIGGSNAHAIVEEAPKLKKSVDNNEYQLICVSAKTKSGLHKACSNLKEYLEESDESLSDISFTLKVGREPFGYRKALVANNIGALVDGLSMPNDNIENSYCSDNSADVAFMFSGQSTQKLNMYESLYQKGSVYSQVANKCADIASAYLNVNLIEVLYPPLSGQAEATESIQNTEYAQLALFIVQYAMARQWESWGVKPKAMIGHGLGEYVAACLSGVFSLKDALRVVCLRGQLMQRVSEGQMLEVASSEDELKNVLNTGSNFSYDIASVDSHSSCVVSADANSIDSLKSLLRDNYITFKPLATSHAFNSRMMDDVLDQFNAQVSEIELSTPKVPFISNLTGTWFTEAQALNPTYWGQHLRQTVRFADGIQTLLEDEQVVFLEIGTGRFLDQFVKQESNDLSIAVVNRYTAEDGNDKSIQAALGELWLAGVVPDWSKYYSSSRNYRVSLPTYPFERHEYCLFDDDVIHHPTVSSNSTSIKKSSENDGTTEDIVTITNIWKRYLGLDHIDVNDNFFDLGGESLLATSILRKINSECNVDLSLSTFYENQTIASLLEHIKNNTLDSYSLPRAIHDEDDLFNEFPLTDVQYSYFIGRQGVYDLGNVGTHSYSESYLSGIDVERLNYALNKVINRHEVLRMVMTRGGAQKFLEDQPRYVVEEQSFVDATVIERREGLENIRNQLSKKLYSGYEWPLFEIRVTHLTEDIKILHYSLDALVMDAFSRRIMVEELTKYYLDPNYEADELSFTYRDYVLALGEIKDSKVYERAKNYWTDRITDLPLAPNLPLAEHVERVWSQQFKRAEYLFDKSEWEELKAIAKEERVTPTILIIGSFCNILSRWSGSSDFCLNLTRFNRLDVHSDVNKILGDFTSISILEHSENEDVDFFENIRLLQDRLWKDIENGYFNGIEVQRELSKFHGRTVFIPIVVTSTLGLAVENTEDGDAHVFADAAVEKAVEDYGAFSVSQTPQVHLDFQVSEKDGGLLIVWDYLYDIFPARMIEDMFAGFTTSLRSLCRKDVSEPLYASDSDYQLASVEKKPIPIGGKCPESLLLHELFEQACQANQEKVAIYTDEKTLTFNELSRYSNHYANRIEPARSGASQPIAIFMEKGWQQVVACFAILKSGSAYVPLDPDWPMSRIEKILKTVNIDQVFSVKAVLDNCDFPEFCRPILIDDDVPSNVAVRTEKVSKNPTDICYIIFTSGSTGEPKGVEIDHRGAVNTILDVNDRFHVTNRDTVFSISSLSFDLSVYDIFGVLGVGGSIVIPTAKELKDPARWSYYIEQYGVTLWNSVPALAHMLFDYLNHKSIEIGMRVIMLSGDWIPLALPALIKQVAKESKIYSLGGATEVSIWSIYYEIRDVGKNWTSIPYGKPLSNQDVFVLDKNYDQTPAWVTGEIYISGIGLAHGYSNDKAKTDYSFVSHPKTGQRIYRTGDLGRLLPDGNIEILGRIDNQVKINGMRIELGEIEVALNSIDVVSQSVVVPYGDKFEERRLAAYLVLDPVFAKGGISNNTGFVDVDIFIDEENVLYDPQERMLFVLSQKGVRELPLSNSAIKLPNLSGNTVDVSFDFKNSIGRTSTRIDANWSLDKVSKILAPLRQVRLEEYAIPKKFYPSPGALYPVQVYMYFPEDLVSGIQRGFYYYSPASHELRLLHKSGRGNDGVYSSSGPEIYLVANYDAIKPMYGYHSRRFCVLEAGFMLNLISANFDYSLTLNEKANGAENLANFNLEAKNNEIICTLKIDENSEKNNEQKLVEYKADDYADDIDNYRLTVVDLLDSYNLGIFERQSFRKFTEDRISLDKISGLFNYIKKDISYYYEHGNDAHKYSIHVYLYIKKDAFVEMEEGLYFYNPLLDTLIKSKRVFAVCDTSYTGINQQIYNDAKFGLYLVAASAVDSIDKNSKDQGESPGPLLEAGFLGQQMMNSCHFFDIGLCPIGEDLSTLFPLQSNEKLLCDFLGGAIESNDKKDWSASLTRLNSAKSDEDLAVEHLSSLLPKYMIPSSFDVIDEIPLGENGKVDKSKLPTPNHRLDKPKSASPPQNELEAQLHKIWTDVLKTDSLNTDDGFFDIGGSSILVMELYKRIAGEVDPGVTITQLFMYPTIREQALHLAPKDVVVEKKQQKALSNKAKKRKSAAVSQAKIRKRISSKSEI